MKIHPSENQRKIRKMKRSMKLPELQKVLNQLGMIEDHDMIELQIPE